MSDARTEAWNNLAAAALEFAKMGPPSEHAKAALSEAAKAWYVANGPAPRASAPASAKGASGHVMPFGRSKGQPIEKEPVKGLEYLKKYLEESVADPSKAKWMEKNQALLDAVNAELETRG